MESKIGVYICKGCDIAKSLDIDKLSEVATDEAEAAVCKTHDVLCSREGVESIRADIERGGVELSELLRRLLAAGATILSCTRHETSLQEVFDLVAGEGAEGGVPGRPAAAGSKGPPGGRSAS